VKLFSVLLAENAARIHRADKLIIQGGLEIATCDIFRINQPSASHGPASATQLKVDLFLSSLAFGADWLRQP
jgi:hypothetical protein